MSLCLLTFCGLTLAVAAGAALSKRKWSRATARSRSSGSSKRGSVIYYRTQDGKADYGFSIERQPAGGYRVYIVSQPSYGTRDSDAHSSHRYTAGDGRRYICWEGTLKTKQDASNVAALWADNTQRYIRSGRTF